MVQLRSAQAFCALIWRRQRLSPSLEVGLAIALIGLLLNVLGGLLPVADQPATANSEISVTALPRPTAQQVVGIVQSSDNQQVWSTIGDRLQRSGVAHHIIDWNRVQQASDLSGLSVLFLPNVSVISANQFQAIEAFVAEGGYLIVSGPVGTASSVEVRQALRSLLGAYWAFALPQPASLRSISPHLVSPELASDGQSVQGGVIVPTGLDSQTLATWQDPASRQPANQTARNAGMQGTPAVVATERTLFLGWQWGNNAVSSAEFDSVWLQVFVARHAATAPGVVPPARAIATSPPSTVPPASTLLSEQIPNLAPATSDEIQIITQPAPTPPPRPRPSRPEITPPENSPSSATSPTLPQTAPAPTPPPTSPSTYPPTIPQAIAPPASTTLFDPTEQVAPPGIPVERGDLPISALEAIAMRQELEHLLGRYESALLSGNSADSSTSLVVEQLPDDGAVLVAGDLEASLLEKGDAPSSDPSYATRSQDVLEQVRGLLDAFPDLVAQRNYVEARETWLEARQLLWENFPTDRALAQPEIRAIWLDRGTIVQAGSRQGLAQIFDRLQQAGINTIFIETVNAGYPIYPSQVAPQQNPLTRFWDPLEAAVELAHARDMEIHAWMWAFATGNQRHNTVVNLPWNYLGPVLEAHPDWANLDHRGQAIPAGQTKPFLDPANPQVRSYLLRLAEEIVTRYDVDGLQLDYIRYPFQDPSAGRTYGYGTASRQQFERLTGVDPVTISPSDRHLWQQWTDFRVEQINSFVADVSRMVRQRRPDAILSVAVFPMSEHERLQKLQQHWEVWARRGDVDLIVTMSYAMDTNRLQRMTTPWLTETDLGAAMVLPGIRLLDLPDAAALDQIQAMRDMPAAGYALFAAENLNLNDNLQAIFNRTQGTEQNQTDLVPFREPFATAAARFTALKREWSFALSSEQLWMREAQLDQWRTQAEALQAALNALAENPSAANLQQAERSLDDFRNQFGEWMYLQSLSDAYRVQTWENRLTFLATLLNYGEARVLN
ncbi:MAG: family 10 glycosylhydrolase [Synechococcales bacterium]|nr:family 10 glycosylhydrolase [Synechococcales bacterium]